MFSPDSTRFRFWNYEHYHVEQKFKSLSEDNGFPQKSEHLKDILKALHGNLEPMFNNLTFTVELLIIIICAMGLT